MENRINIKALNIVLIALLVTLNCSSSDAEQFHGYIKKDILKLKLYQGEIVDCNLKKDILKCCFEEENGKICINHSDISLSKVEMVDLFLDEMKFSDDPDAKIDVCAEGDSIEIDTDGYIWSYGFKVISSNKNVNYPVLVEGSYVAQSNNNLIHSLSITKRWEGKADGACHKLIFTKNDIAKFIKEYQKIKKYIKTDAALNIPATFSMTLFSLRPESNYKNNVITKQSKLPVDSSDIWPPRH